MWCLNCILFYTSCYRPQQSWGKVTFSEECVKNSVHKGSIQACIAGLQAHTQGESWGVWPGGVSRPTPRGSPGQHPGGSPGQHLGAIQAHIWGGLQAHTGGSSGPHQGGSPGTHLGVSRHTPGGYPSMHWGRHPPADSYWHPTGMHSCSIVNAFISNI